MNMNYSSLTTMYESIFAQMYIFLVEKYFLPEVSVFLTKLPFLFVQVNFHTSKSFCDRRTLKLTDCGTKTHL